MEYDYILDKENKSTSILFFFQMYILAIMLGLNLIFKCS